MMTLVQGLSSETLNLVVPREMSPLLSELNLTMNYIGLYTHWQPSLKNSRASNESFRPGVMYTYEDCERLQWTYEN